MTVKQLQQRFRADDLKRREFSRIENYKSGYDFTHYYCFEEVEYPDTFWHIYYHFEKSQGIEGDFYKVALEIEEDGDRVEWYSKGKTINEAKENILRECEFMNKEQLKEVI